MPLGRPRSDLRLTLETAKGQFFYLVYILGKSFVEAQVIFDLIFKQMSRVTGILIQVSPSQWQGRKNEWDKEWNFGPGRSGPTTAVLEDLSMLPLWYDGVTGHINLPLGTVHFNMKSIASLYQNSQPVNIHSLPSQIRLGSATRLDWPASTLPSTGLSSGHTASTSAHISEEAYDQLTQVVVPEQAHGQSFQAFDCYEPVLSEIEKKSTLRAFEQGPEPRLTHYTEPKALLRGEIEHTLYPQIETTSDVPSQVEKGDKVYRTSVRKRKPIISFQGQPFE